MSWTALALAAVQLLVSVVIVVAPAPPSSAGGPLAALMYAAFYAGPLVLLGVGLRSSARWAMVAVALLALAFVGVHSLPFVGLVFQPTVFTWQMAIGLGLSSLTLVVEAAVMVVAVATFSAPGARPKAGSA